MLAKSVVRSHKALKISGVKLDGWNKINGAGRGALGNLGKIVWRVEDSYSILVSLQTLFEIASRPREVWN